MTQVSVWPALGTTVTMDDDITVVDENGAVLTYMQEVADKLRSGVLLTKDPRADGSEEVDYPSSEISSGTPMTVVDLFTRSGSYQGQIAIATNYDTGKSKGGKSFRWDGASTATHDGCTVVGLSGTGRWLELQSGPINLLECGAYGDGVHDDTDAVQNAIDIAAAAGREVYAPAGSYVISDTITIRPTSYNGANGKGPHIYGDGILSTFFVNDVANAALFDVDSSDSVSHIPFRSIMGCVFRGFSIVQGNTAPAASTGIKLRTAYHVEIAQVHIDDMSQDGIEVSCTIGDLDASINVQIDNVRIENCNRWGIKADATSAANELSYLTVRNTQIQNCGTANVATVPPSGGMIWKGQALAMDNVGFTICQNVSLYIKGDTGLGVNVDMRNVTFENSVRKSWYITGCSQLKARNIQIYQSVGSYTSAYGILIDGNPSGTQYLLRDIDIDGVIVRAGSHNTGYAAFTVQNPGDSIETIRVKNVWWQQFTDASFTRFSGFRFDRIAQDCRLQVVNSQEIRYHPISPGTGNSSPLRLRGTGSTSGEWKAVYIAVNGESLVPTTGSGPEVQATDLEGVLLAPSTRYYIYYWDDNGVFKLSFSTTAPTVDSTHGYMVRTGDATRLYVGSVMTTTAIAPNIRIETTGLGWLNPTRIAGSATGTDAYMWVDSTGDVRIKTTAPTSDTDVSSTVVGTQT